MTTKLSYALFCPGLVALVEIFEMYDGTQIYNGGWFILLLVIKNGSDYSISDLLGFWNFWSHKHATKSVMGFLQVLFFLPCFRLFEIHDATQIPNEGMFIVMSVIKKGTDHSISELLGFLEFLEPKTCQKF